MMTPLQIERWALKVIDAVHCGHQSEDHRVELKRDWPPLAKAARLIAGHANAARGEDILWLIGVDETTGVIGVDANNLANWYPSVEAFFNELAPRLTSINVPVSSQTVVALLFETDRAPFVVKNPNYGISGGGSVELEVPWRENTAIRTARRSDLIRLLTPLELLPSLEILEADLLASLPNELSKEGSIYFEASLYVSPKNQNLVVFPVHKLQIYWKIEEPPTETNFEVCRVFSKAFNSSDSNDSNKNLVITTSTEVIVNGPGSFKVGAYWFAADDDKLAILNKLIDSQNVRISAHFFTTHSDRPIVITTNLPCKRQG